MVKIVLTIQKVQSLVRELIPHMLCGLAKKWKKKKKLGKKGNKCFFKREGNSDTCSSTMNFENIVSCSVMSDSLGPHGLWPTRLLCPSDFSGKDNGVGCHFLLQGIFPTQGLNLALQADSLPSGPPGKPTQSN